MKKQKFALAAAGLLHILPMAGHASVMEFTDEAAFLAGTDTALVDFDDAIPAGDYDVVIFAPDVFTFGDLTISNNAIGLFGNPGGFQQIAPSDGGFFNVGSGNVLLQDLGDITLTFANPITALSFIVGDGFGDPNFVFGLVGDAFSPAINPDDWFIPTWEQGGGFFGLTSDTPFTQVMLSGEDLRYGLILDDIRYGTVAAVPLPAGGCLLLLGLVALVGVRRRA